MINVWLQALDGHLVACVTVPMPVPSIISWGNKTYTWITGRNCYVEVPVVVPQGEVPAESRPPVPPAHSTQSVNADPATAAALDMRQRATTACLLLNTIPGGWKAVQCANAVAALPLSATQALAAPNLEALRAEIIAGCERIQSRHIGVSAEERHMAHAQELFWRQATTAELQTIANNLTLTSAEET